VLSGRYLPTIVRNVRYPSSGQKVNPVMDSILTYMPIARQRVGKHIPAEPNVPNSMTSIAR
jgi:hypothetical protein